MYIRPIAIVLSFASMLSSVAVAQGRGGGGAGGAGGGPQAADTTYDVTWRNIGPNQTSRMAAVAGSSARPNEYYMGTTGGGVWKTTDGGVTAVPVTDAYFGGTIGALAVQESNPDVVWSGGGETPIRGNVSHGDGVWKTTDAGKTWQYMGLKETQYISRILIHPTNPDLVYVAALGHVFGPNKERGIYKTTDGGKTWTNIKFVNDSTGAIDLSFDPSNPNTLYTAFWQAGRTPWSLVSGGAGSAIFKSTDGGATWQNISRNPGLPQTGLLGKMGLAVSPAKSTRIWLFVEHEPNGGVYRSDDAGATWQFMTGDRNIRQRAWYYAAMFADPQDTNVVYAPQVSALVSRDGGRTFTGGFGGGDNHFYWIDPKNNRRIAVAHDNGAVFTTDGGTTRTAVAIPTGQYYHVHLTNHFPVYQVCGAKQDASTSCGPVRMGGAGGGGRGAGGAPGGRGAAPAAGPPSPFSTFTNVAGGESGYVSSNPRDPDITFGANYSGTLDRQDRRTGITVSIDPWPLNPMGHDAKDSKYRFQWTFPIVHSPFNPNTVYVGSNVVFKSTNQGDAWTAISPDLTRNDPRTLGPSGGPITKDQTSVEYYGTVFTLDESPRTPGLIWTGSDDGLIHVTRNGGTTWTNVTPKGIPEWMRWSIIEASPHAAGTLWAAGNRYQLDDFRPYLYRTTDYGVTWTKIVTGIPENEFTRAIREDLHRPNLVYATTERSVYYSYDGGRNWKSLKKNLPPVPVVDAAVKDDDLVIATHGRAFWAMENLTPLRWAPEADAAAQAGKPFLYKPVPTYRVGTATPTFVYRLPTAGETVKFEFLDKLGKVLATFASNDTTPAAGGAAGGGRGGGGGAQARPTNRAGINRFSWTMRHPNAVGFRGMIMWQGSLTGPAMAPGTYTVRMTVGSNAPITHPFLIAPDPRSGATEADLIAQADLALMIRDRTSDANNGVIKIRNIKRDLTARSAAMAGDAAFEKLAKALADSLSVVEDSLYQTKNQSGQDPLNYPVRLNNQIAALSGFVSGNDRRPPKQAYDVYGTLAPKIALQLTRLQRLITTDLAKVNAALKAKGQPEIVPSIVEPPAAGGGGGRGRGGGPSPRAF